MFVSEIATTVVGVRADGGTEGGTEGMAIGTTGNGDGGNNAK